MKPINLCKTVIRYFLPVFILVFGQTVLAQTVPTTQLYLILQK